LVVELARIQPYEHNPRHGRNPEYDRIKDSIRTQGLDQPLVITRRPQATDYIVHAGGHTRLMVLKELYEETGDARFVRIPCLFRPWNCESDVLLAHLRENDLRGDLTLAHLRENDLRGDLTFIDKAQAVFETKRLLEAESGTGELTHRQLEVEMRAAGYSVSCGLISRMRYAVEALLPLIPRALEAGIGAHQVVRIRALERAAGALWQRHCSGDDSTFDAVFAALCRRYDGPEWDTGVLQSALEIEIAEEAEISIHTLRVALDAEINGRELVIPEPEPMVKPSAKETCADEGVDTDKPGVHDACDDTETGLVPTDEVPSDVQRSDPAEEPNPSPNDPDDATPTASEPWAEHVITTGQTAPGDLKSLRGRAWTLAARLAQRNGFGDLVVPLPGKGLGFVLSDVPDPALADQLDEDALAQICMLWWQLAACAEMTFAPIESIVPALPSDSVLRRALEDQDAELLFNSIWTLDPGHTGYRLWRPLHDRDWNDLLNLMDTYRRIRHLAAEAGSDIWD
jgi:hypothetical protein